MRGWVQVNRTDLRMTSVCTQIVLARVLFNPSMIDGYLVGDALLLKDPGFQSIVKVGLNPSTIKPVKSFLFRLQIEAALESFAHDHLFPMERIFGIQLHLLDWRHCNSSRFQRDYCEKIDTYLAALLQRLHKFFAISLGLQVFWRRSALNVLAFDFQTICTIITNPLHS